MKSNRRQLPIDRALVEARLDAELSFARRHGTPLAALLIHSADPLLDNKVYRRAFVERLRGLVRIEDELGCDDERTYVVVVRGIAPASLRTMADRLCRSLPQVSIGLAVAEPPREGESSVALLERGRAAVAAAIADGGGRVRVCPVASRAIWR